MVLSGIWKKTESTKDPLPPTIVVRRDKEVSPASLQDLCSAVGWSRRDPLLIARALRNSMVVISVWDEDLLVGFARATGDQVFNATIWDVAVRPSHQRRGLGRLLLQELLKELDANQIPIITLYADPGRDAFYKKLGFSADPSGIRLMFRDKF